MPASALSAAASVFSPRSSTGPRGGERLHRLPEGAWFRRRARLPHARGVALVHPGVGLRRGDRPMGPHGCGLRSMAYAGRAPATNRSRMTSYGGRWRDRARRRSRAVDARSRPVAGGVILAPSLLLCRSYLLSLIGGSRAARLQRDVFGPSLSSCWPIPNSKMVAVLQG
jgi:hypothetical protein